MENNSMLKVKELEGFYVHATAEGEEFPPFFIETQDKKWYSDSSVKSIQYRLKVVVKGNQKFDDGPFGLGEGDMTTQVRILDGQIKVDTFVDEDEHWWYNVWYTPLKTRGKIFSWDFNTEEWLDVLDLPAMQIVTQEYEKAKANRVARWQECYSELVKSGVDKKQAKEVMDGDWNYRRTFLETYKLIVQHAPGPKKLERAVRRAEAHRYLSEMFPWMPSGGRFWAKKDALRYYYNLIKQK